MLIESLNGEYEDEVNDENRIEWKDILSKSE